MDERVLAGAGLLTGGYPNAAKNVLEDASGALAAGVSSVADAVVAGESGAWEEAAVRAADARSAFEAAASGGVETAVVAAFAAAVAVDPEALERRPLPVLRVDGDAVTLDSLDADAALLAGETLAVVREDTDLDAGFEYARNDLDAGETTSQFVRLALDALQGPRGKMAAERLRQHAARRRQREQDVAGLFDA